MPRIEVKNMSYGSVGLLKPGDLPFTVLSKDPLNERIRCKDSNNKVFSLNPNTVVEVR